jgi:hypothetical protein
MCQRSESNRAHANETIYRHEHCSQENGDTSARSEMCRAL